MRSLWGIVPSAALFGCVAGLLASHAACNGNNSPYVKQGDFARLYAQALCTSLQPCCAENGVSQDYASCTQGWEQAVNNLEAAAGTYNGAAATQCLNMVRNAAGAGCQPGPGTLSDARATCQQVFAGQTPPGGACTASSQCAPVDGAVVTCAVVPSDSGAEAGTGGGQLPLSADPGPLVPLDMPVTLEDSPICVVEAVPEGGAAPPCTSNAATGTDSCLSGTYCDPGSQTCMPIGGAAAPCDPVVITSCQPGNYCAAAAAASGEGGAGGAPAEGGTGGEGGTGAGGGTGAEGGAGGAAGVCMPGNPAGTACTNNVECAPTLMCDTANTHQCVALAQPGTACTSNSQCSVGVCDSSTKACLTNAIATTAACNGG